MKLMIIEGPGKLASITKNLNDASFKIFATGGHIKELSKNEKDNDGYGFDFENFNPVFETIPGKNKVIQEMNELANNAEIIYLASDPDREGEGIAYHVYHALSKENQKKCKRITFEEINKTSIVKALSMPRDIDMKLVNAQFARQIFDKLFGYKASRFAYSLMKSNDLSIGRVQSEALHIIVNREQEIKDYTPSYWWTINPVLDINGDNLKLNMLDSEQIPNKFVSEGEIKQFVSLLNLNFMFLKQEAKEVSNKPHSPFNTAKFLEYANKKLNLKAKETQALLQTLYESALTTYPRTDSIKMDDEFCALTYEFVKTNYGSEYADHSYPFNNEKKDKNVQEGHNALRIIDLNINTKELMIKKLQEADVKVSLDQYDELWSVYKAIYDRTLEVFFKPALYNQTVLTFNNTLKEPYNDKKEVFFKASSKVLKFLGWLRYYQDNTDNLEQDKDDEDEVIKISPELNHFYTIVANKIMEDFVVKHSDSCPKRFSEGSLINYLQKKGIGRPSTFAMMVEINNQRKNTELLNSKEIAPLEKGIRLEEFNHTCFSDFINDDFTAELETKLDNVANGNLQRIDLLKAYYTKIEQVLNDLANNEEVKAKYENKEKTFSLANYKCPKCNSDVYIKKDKNCNDYEVCKNYRYNDANSCSYIKFNNNTQELKYANYVCPNCQSKVLIKKDKNNKEYEVCSQHKFNDSNSCSYIKFANDPNKEKTSIIYGKCPKCNKNTYKHVTKNKKEFVCCEDFSFDKSKSKCDYLIWLTNK